MWSGDRVRTQHLADSSNARVTNGVAHESELQHSCTRASTDLERLGNRLATLCAYGVVADIKRRERDVNSQRSCNSDGARVA